MELEVVELEMAGFLTPMLKATVGEETRYFLLHEYRADGTHLGVKPVTAKPAPFKIDPPETTIG